MIPGAPVAGETFYTNIEGDHHRREVLVCGHHNSLPGSPEMIAYKTFKRGGVQVWFDTLANFLASSSKVP